MRIWEEASSYSRPNVCYKFLLESFLERNAILPYLTVEDVATVSACVLTRRLHARHAIETHPVYVRVCYAALMRCLATITQLYLEELCRLSSRSLRVMFPSFRSDGRDALRCVFSYTRVLSCQMGESSSQDLGGPWIARLLVAAGLASR
jgi:hypothetical protein